jgi:predicted permease
MACYDAPVIALGWLGRQGTRAVAALVFIGIAVPPLDAIFKPFVTEAIFVLLCIAFLRFDAAALRDHLGRPAIIAGATIWSGVVIPLTFGITGVLVGLDVRSPDLMLGLVLQAATSPMMAAPALAALMDLDATLVLATLVTTTAVVPFTAPAFAHFFTGSALTLSPSALGWKLFAILAGSALIGLTLRQIIGESRIERRKDEINGLNILMLFVFVAAVMENVAERIFAEPLAMLALVALAFAIFFVLFGLTALVFAWAGRERALALGFMASNRNMGLMLAATGGALPDLTWLYFAVGQFPIYLSPQMLKPFVQRVMHKRRRPQGQKH